jgi:hypothetical protein
MRLAGVPKREQRLEGYIFKADSTEHAIRLEARQEEMDQVRQAHSDERVRLMKSCEDGRKLVMEFLGLST